jgi:hypothetical protein
MGRTKPKQQSKSPSKRIEDSDEQYFLMNITPQPATSRPSTPIRDIYRDKASMRRHMDKLDRAIIQQGLPTMYQDGDLPSTTDTNEQVQQGNTEPSPTPEQDSYPIEADKKMA